MAFQQRINEAALAADRLLQDICRIYNVMGFITGGPVQGLLTGPVDEWGDELTWLAAQVGIGTFSYWPTDDRLRQIGRFATEVIRTVQEQAARTQGKS